MPKDFKIGMGIGLLIVVAAMLWIASRSSFNMDLSVSYEIEQPADRHVSGDGQIPAQDVKKEESLLDILEAEARLKGSPGVLEMEWPKIHVVQQGQTLSQISQQYYGTAGKWQKILDANRLRLKNKDQIRTGMRLLIPE